ncbi:MAG: ABC transporter ATP-binding protein [Clostridia bacterium]|nr:ABC transporter ATP-binding protein [Clostridia bacterium]
MNSILELKNIKKAFGDTVVLNGIDLTVQPGEFITLLGSSGCGKTTTLRIISGLETPDSGTVLLEGVDMTHAEPNRRNVHTVFQNYALFPHMNVGANIGYSLKLQGMKKPDIQKKVKEMLELVQLEGFENRMPGELSGGQRQRVAIARSVVDSPKVLLLDEPLGALDLQLRRMMQIELKRLQKKLGITFIYITHDQEEALNMSDRIAVMRGGLFEQIGTPGEIYDRPKTAYIAKFVGSANILNLNGKCLAVRSEALELKKDGEGYLAGVVKEKSFAGGMLRIAVDTKDCGEIVASRHGIDSPLMPGDIVGITWADGAAVEVEP